MGKKSIISPENTSLKGSDSEVTINTEGVKKQPKSLNPRKLMYSCMLLMALNLNTGCDFSGEPQDFETGKTEQIDKIDDKKKKNNEKIEKLKKNIEKVKKDAEQDVEDLEKEIKDIKKENENLEEKKKTRPSSSN